MHRFIVAHFARPRSTKRRQTTKRKIQQNDIEETKHSTQKEGAMQDTTVSDSNHNSKTGPGAIRARRMGCPLGPGTSARCKLSRKGRSATVAVSFLSFLHRLVSFVSLSPGGSGALWSHSSLILRREEERKSGKELPGIYGGPSGQASGQAGRCQKSGCVMAVAGGQIERAYDVLSTE